MPLVAECVYPGCTTISLGGLCPEHSVPPAVEFPRGRPYAASDAEERCGREAVGLGLPELLVLRS